MGFTFDNGRLCIDFLATEYGSSYARVEMLSSPGSLADWIRAARVVDGARGLGTPELQRARHYRTMIDHLLRDAQRTGQLPEDRRRYLLNGLARRSRPVLQVRGEGRIIRRGGFGAFLAELATDTFELLSQTDELARIGWCAAPECRRIFSDQSAAGVRRWCSKTCRDRRHVATRRAREFRRPRTVAPSELVKP